MISLKAVTFAYGQKKGNQQLAVRPPVFLEFDWQAEQGERWAVLGPSGCGKTTLLYLLAGLLFPTTGQISVNGEPLTRPRPHTGLIIQEYGLLPWATVRENAGLGLRVRNFYGPDGTHTPREHTPATDGRAAPPHAVSLWMERLGLMQVADQYPGQISGGQRQRTAIARTLAMNPDLLLMDEPFSSLDAPTRESLQNLTLELQAEQNLSLVLVTHAIEEAAVLGNKILLLGQPPNTQPNVIENPDAGQPGFRNTETYAALCRELRARLEQI